MSQFESAIIEITGACNARCKWCVTGRENRSGNYGRGKHMSLEKFRRVYRHITELGLVDKTKDLMLYNWGEPFLNPEATDIFTFLSEYRQSYSLSTNASIYKEAAKSDTYRYMSSITFSLPGFSQESYDRIHGFDFQRIKSNIVCLLENMRRNGFKGNALVVFHVYQFNQTEIKSARQFADEIGADFFPYYAYFNGLSLTRRFINGMFSDEELREVKDEICLHYLKKKQEKAGEEYRCPLRNIMTINEEGQLLLCCAADNQIEGYVLGDIFSFDKGADVGKRLDLAMKENPYCVECHAKKIDAWLTQYEKWEGDC